MGGACGTYGGLGGVCTGFWWGNLRERDHWGDRDVDGRIKLRRTFRKWEGLLGTGWSWIRIGTGGATCEYGDELSGSIKCRESLD